MTTIAAFDSTFTIVNTLTGGINTSDRVLVLSQGQAQVNAANNLDNSFAQRLADAQTAVNTANSSPVIDALTHQQSLLASRKDRVNNALGVLNQAQTQIDYIKSNISFLRDRVDAFQAGSIDAATVIDYWDNILRTINNNSNDGAQLFQDGGVYFQKNLIGSNSRTAYGTQTLLAPTSSFGNSIEVSGNYLGSDYFITEDVSGDVFLSDAGFRANETDAKNLVEYTSYPNTLSGVSSVTSDITVNSFNATTGDIQFTSANTGTVDGTVTRGGLQLLDSFLYQSGGAGTFDATAAETDLDRAEGILLTAEAEFRSVRSTLESRTSLFDGQILNLSREIQERLVEIQDEEQAELASVELEFTVAQFNFALLASRGNTLILSLIDSQDAQTSTDNKATGELLIGTIVDVEA